MISQASQGNVGRVTRLRHVGQDSLECSRRHRAISVPSAIRGPIIVRGVVFPAPFGPRTASRELSEPSTDVAQDRGRLPG